MAHCPEEPGLVILASDHDELASLMERALSETSSTAAGAGREADA